MIADFVYYKLYIQGNDPETMTSTLLDPLMYMALKADDNKMSYILEKVKVIVLKDKEDYEENN